MNRTQIIKELDLLEAMADSMKQRAISLREQLGVVSTTPTSRKGKYAESIAKCLANRNKTINKRLAQAK